jgi:hypothetical protein
MWVIVGVVVAALLLAAALMDRGARRRGARVLASEDIVREVREADRDARAIDSTLMPPGGDWTSWNRRNGGRGR